MDARGAMLQEQQVASPCLLVIGADQLVKNTLVAMLVVLTESGAEVAAIMEEVEGGVMASAPVAEDRHSLETSRAHNQVWLQVAQVQ